MFVACSYATWKDISHEEWFIKKEEYKRHIQQKERKKKQRAKKAAIEKEIY